MALEKTVFDELIAARDSFRREVKLLCLGYPDLLVTEQDLRLAGVKEFIPLKDGEAVARWHQWPSQIMDTSEAFKQLNIAPTYVDIHASRGVETILDLNTAVRLPDFDIVLDGGTAEHCANIGNVFRLIIEAAKVGSWVIHVNPISCINHGHYNLNPTLYVDMYEQNGFEVKKVKGMSGPTTLRALTVLPAFDRVKVASEVTAFCVARKVETVPFTWCLQTKYKKNAELKA